MRRNFISQPLPAAVFVHVTWLPSVRIYLEYLVTLRSVFIQAHPVGSRRTEPTGSFKWQGDSSGPQRGFGCIVVLVNTQQRAGRSSLVPHEVTRIKRNAQTLDLRSNPRWTVRHEIRPEAECLSSYFKIPFKNFIQLASFSLTQLSGRFLIWHDSTKTCSWVQWKKKLDRCPKWGQFDPELRIPSSPNYQISCHCILYSGTSSGSVSFLNGRIVFVCLFMCNIDRTVEGIWAWNVVTESFVMLHEQCSAKTRDYGNKT